MPDYSLMARSALTRAELSGLQYDVLISSYTDADRVRWVFDEVSADAKFWVVQPEYGYDVSEFPSGAVTPGSFNEMEFWNEFIDSTDFVARFASSRLCIDITGFMRPHVLYALMLFRDLGFESIDMIYSDPAAYIDGDRTKFATGAVTQVRSVFGFEGSHEVAPEILVIGAGYDAKLISRIASSRPSAEVVEMFGLPSLRPHMYEESRYAASFADESVGTAELLFAPANNPFATAQVLHEELSRLEVDSKNLYLSPLSTKPQTLGFGIYYLCERWQTASSVVFPYSSSYSRETARGLSKVWVYSVELDWFMS